MPSYTISILSSTGDAVTESWAFEDDDAAIAYALPLARGKLIEVRRDSKLVATVDERPCAAFERRAA